MGFIEISLVFSLAKIIGTSSLLLLQGDDFWMFLVLRLMATSRKWELNSSQKP